MVNGLPDRARVVFDDERVVANAAGVLLPAVLARRLGIEAVIDRTVDLGDRAGAANAGRKVMSLVSAMCLGADCIDGCSVLRSGQTRAVLGHRVLAPSTLGTFLRAFTFEHVRQLDKVLADCLSRAWAAGAGPARNDSLWISIRSSARSMAMTSRAPATDTPTSLGITRSSQPTQGPATCFTSVHGTARRTPPAVRCGSSRSSSPVSSGRARAGRSCCARTPGSGTRRS